MLKKNTPNMILQEGQLLNGSNITKNTLKSKVLLHLNENGEILVNKNAPCWIENFF